jgi:plasmid maintenance system killer protein
MEVVFLNKHLEELFKNGCSNKFKFDSSIVEKYIEAVQFLMMVDDIHQIWKKTSLKFEHLSGKRKNEASIRINIKYRLIMDVEYIDEKQTIAILGLTDLTAHDYRKK